MRIYMCKHFLFQHVYYYTNKKLNCPYITTMTMQLFHKFIIIKMDKLVSLIYCVITPGWQLMSAGYRTCFTRMMKNKN